MTTLCKGRFEARLAAGSGDVALAQELRAQSFSVPGAHPGRDTDPLDSLCRHVLIEEVGSRRLVCCFRVLVLSSGAEIAKSYAARYYDLSALSAFHGKMFEIGRFCIEQSFSRDPDIVRVAWGALTQMVDEEGAAFLFGCSSFAGTEPHRYLDAFAMLKERHLAPAQWAPRVKAQDVFRFGNKTAKPDVMTALRTMPPLLRSYVMMGGWVSDHAVVDRGLNTLHVFTGLEISAIPAARARTLRGVAREALLAKRVPEEH